MSDNPAVALLLRVCRPFTPSHKKVIEPFFRTYSLYFDVPVQNQPGRNDLEDFPHFGSNGLHELAALRAQLLQKPLFYTTEYAFFQNGFLSVS